MNTPVMKHHEYIPIREKPRDYCSSEYYRNRSTSYGRTEECKNKSHRSSEYTGSVDASIIIEFDACSIIGME
jgi:hypothetical protein